MIYSKPASPLAEGCLTLYRQESDNDRTGFRIRGTVDESQDNRSLGASFTRRSSFSERRPSFGDSPSFDSHKLNSLRGRERSPRGYNPRFSRIHSPGRGNFLSNTAGGIPRKGRYKPELFPYRRNESKHMKHVKQEKD